MIHTATSWAARMGYLAAAAQKAAPSAKSWQDAAACEVKRSDVPSQLLEDIERTVRMASRTLGLDPAPRLRWLPEDTKGIRGVVFDDALDEIWVKLQERDATRDTALHELRHVYQMSSDQYLSMGLHTYEQRQADADEFARTWSPFSTPPTAPPRKAQPMMHAQRPYGGRETWTHKGVTYVECERCDAGVPLNTTHSCRPSYSTKTVTALMGQMGSQQPGTKYGHVGYHVKAL